MSCKVNKLVAFDCEDVRQGGVDTFVIILNYSEWKNATVTVDGATGEITDISLTTQGDAGFKWSVPKSSNLLPTSALRAVDAADGYDHSIDMRLQTIEQLDVENIAKIRFNKVVIIAKQLDGRALLVGAHADATPSPSGVGMRLSEDDANISDPSTGGSVHFIAKTPDNDPPEMKKPTLIATSFDIESLLTPVP